MPPPLVSQSLPDPPLFPGCGPKAYVAGGEGLHAPLEPHGNVQPATVVSENRHEQASISRETVGRLGQLILCAGVSGLI